MCIASQQAVRVGGIDGFVVVVVVGSGSRGCGEFKNPNIIPYTAQTMMTVHITPRSGSGTPRKKDNIKFHIFSDATSFFNNVGAIEFIEGVRRRPRCSGSGGGGYVGTASVGTRTMTIVLLLSSAACGGCTFVFCR